MFDIQKALDKFEKELNDYPCKGFKLKVDKEDYGQDIGNRNFLILKVRALYDIESEPCTQEESAATFYTAISSFAQKGQRGFGGVDFLITIEQQGAMSLQAEVIIPMTYQDFGDQL